MTGCHQGCSASLTGYLGDPTYLVSGLPNVIGWAWRASENVDRNWRLRSKFVLSALKHRSLAESLRHAPAESPIGNLIGEWPDSVGYLLWPYQCAAWDA